MTQSSASGRDGDPADAGGMPSARPPFNARVTLLCAIFVLSGFCGLIYESIWSHYLKLFVGHAAYAQSLVLVVFIGGMAVGAWAVGHYAERIRQPLMVYAIVEGAIGVVSLLFHDLFVRLTDWAYVSLLPSACVPESACLVQWALAALFILPQSILLGTTFPLMTAGVLRIARERAGERIALFYFLNSIGAVFGVLASGFVLIPALGLPGTLLTAALLNIAVAIGAYLCAKGTASPPVSIVAPSRDGPEARGFVPLLLLVAGLTGLASFVYEIVWIRMLSMVVGASTHSFELMLAAFILGLALGGAWVRKRIDHFPNLLRSLGIVQVIMGIAAVGTLPLYGRAFDFLAWLLGSLNRSEGGYFLYNVASHAIALAVMLPATFLAGMTLPLITATLMRGRQGERAIGFVYAANTLGAILGVVIAVHVALPFLGVKGGLLLGAALDIGLGIALLLATTARPALRSRLGWSVAGVGALAGVTLFAQISPERMASGVYRSGSAALPAASKVLFHEDGKTATISVVDGDAVRSIRTNGKPDASLAHNASEPTSDEYTMTLTALLPLLHVPDARHAAVIGFGSGMTTATMLASPRLLRVDTIEIEPRIVEGARLLGPRVEAAFQDSRSRVVIDDAKSYFARSSVRYDVIVSEPSNPWVSGVSSLFTREFYRRVKQQLADEGVFVQWLQTYEFSDALMATILRALDAEFPDYVVYAANDSDMIIVASPRRVPRVSEDAVTRWPAMRALLARFRIDTPQEIEARRVAGRNAIRAVLPRLGAGENSDYFPIVDQQAPMARFTRSNADFLMRMATAGVPVVEMLEDRAASAYPVNASTQASLGARRAAIPVAQDLAAFLPVGSVPGAQEPVLPRDAGLLRSILWECASVPPRVRVATLLNDMADYVNPYLPAPEAAKVWSAIRGARCASRLDAADRRWLELFEATGARDAERMAKTGSELAGDPQASPRMRVYAMTAAATGMIVRRQHAEARDFLQRQMASQPAAFARDPALILLAQLALEGNAAP